MTLREFKTAVAGAAAPAGLTPPLLALWHDARGNWTAAHDVVQDDESREAAWVHAYLHRKEGDLSNASYWYRRAERPAAGGDPGDEWETIASTLLPGAC